MPVEKKCSECSGTEFRAIIDSWMKRTFLFVEKGQLNMCNNCGAKFLICPNCGALLTRVHPALEKWEVTDTCGNCGYVDKAIKAWDGVSAR